MLTEKEIFRYDRQIKLDAVGLTGQEKLKAAKVLIIGAGGLGCPVIQYLAAAGIGHITIIDGDVISESNLQRQILFNQNEIGLPKAETAAAKAKLINPYIQVNHIYDFLSNQLALSLFKDYSLVIDCCDKRKR